MGIQDEGPWDFYPFSLPSSGSAPALALSALAAYFDRLGHARPLDEVYDAARCLAHDTPAFSIAREPLETISALTVLQTENDPDPRLQQIRAESIIIIGASYSPEQLFDILNDREPHTAAEVQAWTLKRILDEAASGDCVEN